MIRILSKLWCNIKLDGNLIQNPNLYFRNYFYHNTIIIMVIIISLFLMFYK